MNFDVINMFLLSNNFIIVLEKNNKVLRTEDPVPANTLCDVQCLSTIVTALKDEDVF